MGKNIWRQCKCKNRYRDEHTVNYYRRKFEQDRGKKLDYYWCPYCNGFHLTSVGVDANEYEYYLTEKKVNAYG